MSDYYLGEVRMFAGAFAPIDWHLCDGTLLNISQYQALYTLLGITWGGNGTTTFGLPDLRGRVPLGQGAGLHLTSRTIGQMGGTETVALSDAKYLPNHNHGVSITNTVADVAIPSVAVNLAQPPSGAANFLPQAKVPTPPVTRVMNTSAVETVGTGQLHANMMQSFAVNYIICTNGLFPQRQ